MVDVKAYLEEFKSSPRVRIAALWYTIIVISFVIVICAIVAADQNDSAAGGNRGAGFAAIWSCFMIVGLAFGGTMVLRKVRQLCFAPMERRAGVARSRCMRIARCAPRASPALLSRRVAISARATQSRCSHKGCACVCRTREERETACLTRLCPSPLSFPPPPPRLVAARLPTPQYHRPLAVGIFLGTRRCASRPRSLRRLHKCLSLFSERVAMRQLGALLFTAHGPRTDGGAPSVGLGPTLALLLGLLLGGGRVGPRDAGGPRAVLAPVMPVRRQQARRARIDAGDPRMLERDPLLLVPRCELGPQRRQLAAALGVARVAHDLRPGGEGGCSETAQPRGQREQTRRTNVWKGQLSSLDYLDGSFFRSSFPAFCREVRRTVIVPPGASSGRAA